MLLFLYRLPREKQSGRGIVSLPWKGNESGSALPFCLFTRQTLLQASNGNIGRDNDSGISDNSCDGYLMSLLSQKTREEKLTPRVNLQTFQRVDFRRLLEMYCRIYAWTSQGFEITAHERLTLS